MKPSIRRLKQIIFSSAHGFPGPSELSDLPNLENIYFTGTKKIVSLPPLRNCPRVRSINLSGCSNLEFLPDLDNLPALEEIILHSCVKICCLPSLENCLQLKIINLDYCERLISLPEFSESSQLLTLSLRHCKSNPPLGPIRHLRNLNKLDLTGYRGDFEFDTIRDLSELRTLDLFDSTASGHVQGTDVFGCWPSLEYLSTDQLAATPSEILSKTDKDNCLDRLRAWWHDLQQGEAETHEIKLFILGNGRVGKTQLFRRLRGDGFDASQPSTHGIQLGRFQLGKHHDGKPIMLNAWDFGGQDIYLGTHALFLKSRAIFVVAWHPDSETDAPYTETVSGLPMRHRPLQYWLDYVHSLAGNEARVLIVQTQCAREHDRRVPPVHAAHGFAWCEHTASCASEEDGMEALQSMLKRAAKHRLETPLPPRLPASWLAVRDRLQALREDEKSIDRARFDEVCRGTREGASPDALLHYLHQAGDVFHEPGLFENRIVLDQQWALDAIYALYRREGLLALLLRQGGVFAPELLSLTGWNSRYSPHEQALLLSMMASCDLIFPLQDGALIERSYAMIDALPLEHAMRERLNGFWPRTDAILRARLQYAFLHEGIVRRCLAHIGRRAGPHGLYWRDGCCFYDTGYRSHAKLAAVREASGAGHIEIETTGRNAAGLRDVLVELLKDIGIGAAPVLEAEREPPASTSRLEPLNPGPAPLPADRKPVVYLSYAWGGDDRMDLREFALRFCAAIDDDFDVRRDDQQMGIGHFISDFEREIGAGIRVAVLLSEKYLQSLYCMRELSYLYHRHLQDPRRLQRHILPLVLEPDLIANGPQRMAFLRFWQSRLDALTAETAGIDPMRCIAAHQERADIAHILLHLDKILAFLADMISLHGTERIAAHDFAEVKAALTRIGEA
jgi:internalin A